MKCTLNLDEEQTVALESLALNHKFRDFRVRATGLLKLAEGMNPKAIAKKLSKSVQSVYNWCNRWREEGIEGIMGGHKGGRPAALPEAMLETAKVAAEDKPMTLHEIERVVEEKHGVPFPCCSRTLSKGLKKKRISFKRTRYSLKEKRDPVEFEKKREALNGIRAAASDNKCRLIYVDEAKFCASPPVQRSWSPVGKPHRIEPANHTKRSVLGALDYGENRIYHEVHSGSTDRERFIKFIDNALKELNSSSKISFVVLDNASIHHGIPEEVIDRWLIDHKALLVYLPAYSPELNLIEIIWKQAKYHWRRFVTWSRDTFEQELNDLLYGYGTKFVTDFK